MALKKLERDQAGGSHPIISRHRSPDRGELLATVHTRLFLVFYENGGTIDHEILFRAKYSALFKSSVIECKIQVKHNTTLAYLHTSMCTYLYLCVRPMCSTVMRGEHRQEHAHPSEVRHK